jgi:hypothetical protein
MSEAEKPEAAYVLFPDDKPRVPEKAPDWFSTQQSAARARLAGHHSKPDAKPDEVKGAPEADAADALFKEDAAAAKEFKGEEAFAFIETYRKNAIQAGNEEHAEELAAASKALTEDAVKHGTSTEDFKAAMDVVRERHDFLKPPEPETIEAEMNENLATLEAELGDTFQSDLDAARRFVSDLEKVAPGTMESLAVSGAGNDLRLVRKAIAEARRRGY